jgi:hypothetical protein
MFTDLITVLAVTSLFALRLGIPILVIWLLSKALKRMMAVLP